jgi:hypothetical protein
MALPHEPVIITEAPAVAYRPSLSDIVVAAATVIAVWGGAIPHPFGVGASSIQYHESATDYR